jgi:hypothetical protein
MIQADALVERLKSTTHMNQRYVNEKSICILSLKLEFQAGGCHNLNI